MQLISPVLAFALLCGPVPPARAAAADNILRGHLLGIEGDTIRVNMDVFHKLKPGKIGLLKRKGVRIGSVEVVRVDEENVFLRVLDSARSFAPRAGDAAYFTISDQKPEPAAGAGRGGEDLTPLLAPPAEAAEKKKVPRKVSTRSHGRALLRKFYQKTVPSEICQRVTRIDTDGTIDRIAGGFWSFTWSGYGSYLDANRPSVSYDFRRFRPRARRLTVAHPLGETGFFKAGRFSPTELPGLGTVDGLAIQAPAGWLSLGAVAGARPERFYQGFSSHEMLGSLYATTARGTPGQGSYAATLGVMHTTWRGNPDELAVLFDQNIDFGPRLGIYQTAQLDFNNGAAKVHKGVRLTRLDVSINSTLSKWFMLRGGANHYEPIDAAAERAMMGGVPPFGIDNGYWRWWLGSGQTLPGNMGLDEEISWTRTGGQMQSGLWRATLWHQGLPWLPDGSVYVTGYNLASLEGTDYGGSAGMAMPMAGGKFLVDASAGFNYYRSPSNRRQLKLGDASLRLDWRPTRVWQIDMTGTKVWRDATGSFSLSAGLTYRW